MTEVIGIFPAFRSDGKLFRIHGRGWAFSVELDRTRDEEGIKELSQSKVIIDGKIYQCRGVERFMHCSPWHAREPVGLLVEGDDNGPKEVEF